LSQSLKQVETVLESIRVLLLELGFSSITVVSPYKSELNYVHDNLYCIPRYIESLGFLIEYADSLEDAINQRYEDGDVFSLALGVGRILDGIKKEVLDEIT
jgi:hypothetical protein